MVFLQSLTLFLAAVTTTSKQIRFSVNDTVITPGFSNFVQRLLTDHHVKGLSLAVVRADGVEYGAWGNSTEEGDSVTPDVSLSLGE